MLFNLLNVLVDTTGQDTADELASKIITGLSKVGPWLCGILAAAVVCMLVYNLIKFFLAKQNGNEQDAEKNKKGIIWGVALLIVCASFGVVFGFLVDIANAFGANISKPSAGVAVIYLQQIGLLIKNLL